MLNKIIDFVSSNLFASLGVPTALSGVTWISNLFQSLNDGRLSHSELQHLISSASGVEFFLLLAAMFLIRYKK